jgi:hypothetical protein
VLGFLFHSNGKPPSQPLPYPLIAVHTSCQTSTTDFSLDECQYLPSLYQFVLSISFFSLGSLESNHPFLHTDPTVSAMMRLFFSLRRNYAKYMLILGTQNHEYD